MVGSSDDAATTTPTAAARGVIQIRLARWEGNAGKPVYSILTSVYFTREAAFVKGGRGELPLYERPEAGNGEVSAGVL
jgi:hypothetical protein